MKYDKAWGRKATAVLHALTNAALFIAGVANLGIGTLAAIRGEVASASTSLTAGLVLLFASTIDRFESLKGLGMQAKTRQLDQKIEEADELVRSLKSLAELTGASLIELNSRVGRWGGAPAPADAYALAMQVRGQLTALGSDPDKLGKALTPWARLMCLDLSAALLAPVEKIVHEKRGELAGQRNKVREADDPKSLETREQLRRVRDFDSALKAFYLTPLHDFPDRLLAVFDDIVSLDARIAPLRANAAAFADDMLRLRRDFSLPNPEAWFREIATGRGEP